MAAERYRGWAGAVDDATVRAGLLACAAREDEIAARVEAVHPDADGCASGVSAPRTPSS